MKKIIKLKLKIIARLILAKYKPKIVGVTGSVGKTSTKEAVFTVLNEKFNTRRNIKNYNNEIGLPLTIIGLESPGRSLFRWFVLFVKSLKLILFQDKNYPKIIVLEMGIDRPGDMKYLMEIVKPDVGVMTVIGASHLEYFGTIDRIKKEKGEMIKNVPKTGTSVLNYDDEKSRQILNWSKAKVITYGFDNKASVRAQEVVLSYGKDTGDLKNIKGISFKLSYNGSSVPVFLPDVVGRSIIYSALAGAAVGISFGMNMLEISNALKALNSPKGRMNLIDGIKNTLIIDDTYNSSPQSSLAALRVMKEIKLKEESRKFAVLGDMYELGNYTEQGHRDVGGYVFKSGVNKLITVGEIARDIGRGAKEAGMKVDDIFNFKDSETAGRFLQNRISEGDLILVKGSQGIRTEKIVKEIMADPLRSKELLVRQDKEWEAS